MIISVGQPTGECDAALKYRSEDFIVRESRVCEFVPAEAADYQYLLLRKRGLTTMDAVRRVAAFLNIETALVGYCGLKDEDGITEQLLSVPMAAGIETSTSIVDTGHVQLKLLPYGYGIEPMRIGELQGNAFSVTVRSMRVAVADQVKALIARPIAFLNYYDVQRFGVPGGPRRTHYVGSALRSGEWDSALSEVSHLKAPESSAAAEWHKSGRPSRDFFRELDPRTTSFYLAAFQSYLWNRDLKREVISGCAAVTEWDEGESLVYAASYQTSEIATLAGRTPTLPYAREKYVGDVLERSDSTRTTVVQVVVRGSDHAPDEMRPGRVEMKLSFFLPSGTYATMLLRQILHAAHELAILGD